MTKVWEVTFTTRHDLEEHIDEVGIKELRSIILNQGGPLFSTSELAEHCVEEALSAAKHSFGDAHPNEKRVVAHENTIAIMWLDEQGDPVYYACIHEREIDAGNKPEGRMQ